MDKEIEKRWQSYFAQNIKINLKNMYKDESVSCDEMINIILNLCGEDFTKHFVSWLYDYVTFKEKIAFELGYKIAKME